MLFDGNSFALVTSLDFEMSQYLFDHFGPTIILSMHDSGNEEKVS